MQCYTEYVVYQNNHHSLPASDLPQCLSSDASLRPVTIKGKGAVFPLLDHTCILRFWLSTLEEVQPGGKQDDLEEPRRRKNQTGGRQNVGQVCVV